MDPATAILYHDEALWHDWVSSSTLLMRRTAIGRQLRAAVGTGIRCLVDVRTAIEDVKFAAA